MIEGIWTQVDLVFIDADKASNTDRSVLGTRALADALAAEPRLDATAVQTVGDNGYDGFVLALVR
jgi:hypothetical protein